MPKRKHSPRPNNAAITRVVEPNAAGIDIGATEIFVAVPVDRDPQPVRSFATFTCELEKIAAWLKTCSIESVAMESTGVFWIPLFQILEDHGFRVWLVNARHVKNVPGRKTDVADCQWLQYLHAVGLLRASHRPPQAICAMRSIWRHRDSLIQMASVHIQHMQKALDQMNIQLHHVIVTSLELPAWQSSTPFSEESGIHLNWLNFAIRKLQRVLKQSRNPWWETTVPSISLRCGNLYKPTVSIKSGSRIAIPRSKSICAYSAERRNRRSKRYPNPSVTRNRDGTNRGSICAPTNCPSRKRHPTTESMTYM